MKRKTIIIGAGMAGMSCAHTLQAAGEDFLLVTENLGGRVRYDAESGINFGAYFVMAGYTHAKKILELGSWINPANACFHNSPKVRFSLLSGRTVSLLPELVRFLGAILEFNRHYKVFKKRCLTETFQGALDADPYMRSLYAQPASDYICEKRFVRAASDFISKFSYACTGVAPDQLSALDFLNVSTGMLTPIHKFIFDAQQAAAAFGESLVVDSISAINPMENGYEVQGERGTYIGQNLVVAAPAFVTRNLLHFQEIREACQLYVYQVRALLKPAYRRFTLNLFPPGSQIILTAKEHDGSYLIYAREENPDFSMVCEEYAVLREQAWEKAMYVHGQVTMPQVLGAGLYTAGDHNGLGLEPAAISGIFAANQIIDSSAALEHEIH